MSAAESASTPAVSPSVRRELRGGDAEAIVALHERIYASEHGLDASFLGHVRSGVEGAVARGWPEVREGAWIVDRDGAVAGCLGLTDEGSGLGAVRWFALEPELRGAGLGRRLLGELVEHARRHGYRRLGLETFSELRAAARLYGERGFRLVWSRTGPRWGRESLEYQRWELELDAPEAPGRGDGPRETPAWI